MKSVTIKSNLRDDPVIIVGMHHSGTSILAKIVAKGGIFIVTDMGHHESTLFTLTLNNKLIMKNQWHGDPIMTEESVMSFQKMFDRFLDETVDEYFKNLGYDGNSRWGFKDPRVCVLMPLYLKRYPSAKFIHIIRDEQAVYKSLFTKNKSCNKNLDYWINVQKQHIDRVKKYSNKLSGKNFYEIKYEDLCLNPQEIVKDLYSWLELPFDSSIKEFLEETIYVENDVIQDFIEQVVLMSDGELKKDRSEWLKKYGNYNKIEKYKKVVEKVYHTEELQNILRVK